MRAAAARVASRRGSSISTLPSPRHPASSRASGTSVVLPAPGGATNTAFRPAARADSSGGTASVTGSKGNMLVVRWNLRHMRTNACIRGLMTFVPRVILFAMLVGWCLPAAALESVPVTSARATASLVSDVDAIVPGGSFRIGLRLRLAPGWHTYWRNPGDAGVAPELSLDLPAGATAGPIAWPVPQRVAEGPLMTYAYTGELLLPVTVTGPPEGGASIRAHADWLVCREICVPEEGDFRIDLPAGTAVASAQAPLFAAFDRQMPRPS